MNKKKVILGFLFVSTVLSSTSFAQSISGRLTSLPDDGGMASTYQYDTRVPSPKVVSPPSVSNLDSDASFSGESVPSVSVPSVKKAVVVHKPVVSAPVVSDSDGDDGSLDQKKVVPLQFMSTSKFNVPVKNEKKDIKALHTASVAPSSNVVVSKTDTPLVSKTVVEDKKAPVSNDDAKQLESLSPVNPVADEKVSSAPVVKAKPVVEKSSVVHADKKVHSGHHARVAPVEDGGVSSGSGQSSYVADDGNAHVFADRLPTGASALTDVKELGGTSATQKSDWHIKRGESLHDVLMHWTKRVGWQLDWQPNFEYRIVANADLYDIDFQHAVSTLIGAYEQASPPLGAHLYSGNKLLRVYNPADADLN